MATWLWADATYGTLAASVAAGATSASITPVQGSFPSPTTGQRVSIVINPNTTGLADFATTERAIMTANSSNNFTLAASVTNNHSVDEYVVLVATATSLLGIETYNIDPTVINLMNGGFGAYGNMIIGGAGSVSAGSTAFTDTTAAFTSADTGKTICINSAGIALCSSMVASVSNGGTIANIASWSSPSAGVLGVVSTANFPTQGTLLVAASGSTIATIGYTGISGNTFTGCTYVGGSPSGTLSTGGVVTSPTQAFTTTVTYVSATALTLGVPAITTVSGAAYFYGNDDTPAFTNALAAAASVAQTYGRATIQLGFQHLIAGALKTSTVYHNGTSNSQIPLPVVFGSLPEPFSILFQGYSPELPMDAYQNVPQYPLGTTIATTLGSGLAFSASVGIPSIIGGPATGQNTHAVGLPPDHTNMEIGFEGVQFLGPALSYPTFLDLGWVSRASLRNVAFLTTGLSINGTTNVNNCGVILPQFHGNGARLENVFFGGLYCSLVPCEHMNATNIYTVLNYSAIGVLTNSLNTSTSTVASVSSGVNVNTFTGTGILNVASGAAFSISGGVVLVNNSNAPAPVAYTGVSGNTLIGCTTLSGATGTMSTGGAVQSVDCAWAHGAYIDQLLDEDNSYTITGFMPGTGQVPPTQLALLKLSLWDIESPNTVYHVNDPNGVLRRQTTYYNYDGTGVPGLALAPGSGGWDVAIGNSGPPGTILATHVYAPGSIVSYTVAATTITALDATNLTLAFTVPTNGIVDIDVICTADVTQTTTNTQLQMALLNHTGGALVGSAALFAVTQVTSGNVAGVGALKFHLTGLTPGPLQLDLAAGRTNASGCAATIYAQNNASLTVGSDAVGPLIIQAVASV